MAPFLLAGLVLALVNAPGLNLLSLGEDVAARAGRQPRRHALDRARRDHPAHRRGHRGVRADRVRRARRAARLPGVHRAGPPLARPRSGLAGAVLLLVADVVGRVVVRPGELQVGIVLALVGAPFFVALVRRRRLASL